MSLWQCPVCKGTYRDPQGDGTRYFHQCPPLSLPELMALAPAELAALYPELPAPFTADDLLVASTARSVPRDGARNENIVRDAPKRVVTEGAAPSEDDSPRVQDQPPRILKGP